MSPFSEKRFMYVPQPLALIILINYIIYKFTYIYIYIGINHIIS